MKIKKKFNIIDYKNEYGPIMCFNSNKKAYIHQWYPFVEGYSKDFIQRIISELNYKPQCCLDPFAGSGTTPLELQKLGHKCVSFEVNPFMHALSTTKMRIDYSAKTVSTNLKKIELLLSDTPKNIASFLSPPFYKSIVEKKELTKWIFDKSTMEGLLDVKYAISKISTHRYKKLFNIVFASVLLEVSNVYRNGKCLSYKKDWEMLPQVNRQKVHKLFIDRIKNVILPDILMLDAYKNKNKQLLSNYSNCFYGSFKKRLPLLKNNSVDLVITSPPYLNSRDYTDIYMVELWMLDFVDTYEKLKELRYQTLRSHVQVNWGEVAKLKNPILEKACFKLSKEKDKFWNKNLLTMIYAYFDDINFLFMNLKEKMQKEGRVYFNVANSAYYGIEIKVDEIIASIAQNNGFEVDAIREARRIKPSSQQKDQISYLRESVIVAHKNS